MPAQDGQDLTHGATQYSLFGAEVQRRRVDDLDGLLLAGAQWVRSAAGARLSVRVADGWRAQTLAAEFAERGLAGPDSVVDAASALGDGFAVRTVFSEVLVPHAARWTRGASTGVPADFELGANGLRLWAIATGRRDDVGYLLATTTADTPVHAVAGAQLSRLGVAAVALTQRGGPGWRITSARRLRRLVELLGAAPAGAGRDWPSAVSAVAGLAES